LYILADAVLNIVLHLVSVEEDKKLSTKVIAVAESVDLKFLRYLALCIVDDPPQSITALQRS
jgi:uncharacterized ferredoxin-like protein